MTCLGAAAVLAACGDSDNLGGGEGRAVDPPAAQTGAADSGVTAPQPTAAAGPRPGPSTTPSQPSPSPGPAPVGSPAGTGQPSAAMPPAATPPAVMPPAGATPTTPGMPTPGKLALDECGLETKYPGDEYCIKSPPADKGFQMHIGPTNYDNPESRFVLQPGQEITENIGATAGNTSEVYYYWRQYRMRPGSHT